MLKPNAFDGCLNREARMAAEHLVFAHSGPQLSSAPTMVMVN